MAIIFQEGLDHIKGNTTMTFEGSCDSTSIVELNKRIVGNSCLKFYRAPGYTSAGVSFNSTTIQDPSKGKMGFWINMDTTFTNPPSGKSHWFEFIIGTMSGEEV